MTARSPRTAAAVICLGVVGALAAGCASSGLEITRSDQRSSASTVASTDASVTTGAAATTAAPTTTSAAAGDPTAVGAVAWTPCAAYPSPYECGVVEVPLDYAHAEGTMISIAVIRLRAADPSLRIGSLLLNPGGPGGSGISLVYDEGDTFPQRVLDRFDIVGFDPRGVGASAPVVCPAAFDPGRDSYDDCIDPNIDVLPFLGTTNVARDMDQIRAAVGDAQLTYLGFSYGTALGAVYADLFPDRVRAMVLDGAVDPAAGLSNTSAGGSDFYADQDFDATISVFEDLCDIAASCGAGPHTRELVDRIRAHIRDLPTAAFASGSGPLSKGDVYDVMVNAMYSVFDWPMLATALEDADNGDASTLAALYSWLLYGYPADTSSEADSEFANIAIRCADFAHRGAGSSDCRNFPTAADPLPAITPVDTATPILVVGTKSDPATPGRYAPQMAVALGDAVAIEWEGAGHTATLTSACITDIVAAYLVEQAVPADGTTCAFVAGTTTMQQWADAVFADADPAMSTGALVDVLVARGDSEPVAECVAAQLALRASERLIVHQLLGVDSPELLALRGTIEVGCRRGG